jgi:hypothetical protein
MLADWSLNYVTIFKWKSPLFIGCFSFWRGVGGLTREFWAVFVENSCKWLIWLEIGEWEIDEVEDAGLSTASAKYADFGRDDKV